MPTHKHLEHFNASLHKLGRYLWFLLLNFELFFRLFLVNKGELFKLLLCLYESSDFKLIQYLLLKILFDDASSLRLKYMLYHILSKLFVLI
jgi:hypothetical protein